MDLENDSLDKIVQGRWPVEWPETPQVNRWYDNVRRISETHVVKVLRYVHSIYGSDETQRYAVAALKKLHDEYVLQKQAYDLGLSVPKPEGIFEVKTSSNPLLKPGFVMEYIEGPVLAKLLDEGKKDISANVIKLMFDELDKAFRLGFIPEDYNYSNVIWCPKKDKVYLIDLEQWRFWGK